MNDPERMLRELHHIQEIGAAMLAEREPGRVLRLIAVRAKELMDASTSLIGIVDARRGYVRVRVAAGDKAEALEGADIPLEGTLGGHVVRTGEPLLANDARTDERGVGYVAELAGGRSIIIAPLTEADRVLGVIGIGRSGDDPFDDDDLFVASRFASLASLALQNARAVEADRYHVMVEAELELSRVQQEMKTQTVKAVLQAQEAERERLAHDLHETIGQTMASALLGLKVASDLDDIDKIRSTLADLRDLVGRAAGELRRIAVELRPTVLDDHGLTVALDRLAADVSERMGVDVRTDVEVAERLDRDLETAIYRIAQEVVTNAARSGETTRVDVALRDYGHKLRLSVSADTGEDVSVYDSALGVLGLRERASVFHGIVDVRSGPGRTTVVSLVVPRRVDDDAGHG